MSYACSILIYILSVSGYTRAQYNHLPYASSVDEILLKTSPFRGAVRNQLGSFHVELGLVVDTLAFRQLGQDYTYTRDYILTLLNIVSVYGDSGVECIPE